MWTSAELYLATTSQPAMQLPQKWQAGRASGAALRVDFADVNHFDAQFGRAALDKHVAAFHRDWRQENAVGQIFQMVEIAADAHFALDAFVVGRQVLVVDGPISPAPSIELPLKSRWLKRRATAFQSIVLPPTPRERSESNPGLPGFMVGMCRLGNSKGMAWVLKSVRVLTFGPPSTMRRLTPCLARWAASVPPAAPDPTITTS